MDRRGFSALSRLVRTGDAAPRAVPPVLPFPHRDPRTADAPPSAAGHPTGEGEPVRGIACFAAGDVVPDAAIVLLRAGIPAGVEPSARTRRLLDEADRQFVALAEPRGIVAELPPAACAEVVRGSGLNDPETVLDRVLPPAEATALFAATLGEPLCARIGTLTAGGDLPLGFMLDALASEAADGLAWRLGALWRQRLAGAGRIGAATRVLPYSPGYCGWHVRGQEALFRALDPEPVGIALNASCLMSPLKSVSGVLVAAAPEAHRFRPDFSFCASCTTHECRARMAPWPDDGRTAAGEGEASWIS